MAPRAISSGTISFGLVSIPVKLYTAASSEQVGFNLLHDKCGSRLKMNYRCPVCDETVERGNMVKGFEYARDQYVRFTDDELKALEAERTNSMDIVEFVPLSSVDFVHVERSYYLGPDKGGDRPYQLLRDAMADKERVAVGMWSSRGKEQLVLLRPYGERGLIVHQLYHADEVRSFGEIELGAGREFPERERGLAGQLIDQLTEEKFDPSKYSDTYAERVRAAVEQKVAGQEITVAPEQPRAQIIDLFDALKKSLSEAQERPKSVRKAAPRPAPEAEAEVEDKAKPLRKAGPRKAAAKKTG